MVKLGLRVLAALWSLPTLFPMSTVASRFPCRAVLSCCCSNSSSDRKRRGLGTLFQRPCTVALKREALDDGLILFRSLNKCLVGRRTHSCVCLTTITSWAEQHIQRRLRKGQDERGAAGLINEGEQQPLQLNFLRDTWNQSESQRSSHNKGFII